MVDSHKIKEKILSITEEIKKVSCGEKIVIAFSGGLDSTVVSKLAILALGHERVEAITINFGDYSYAKAIKNIQMMGEALGLRVKSVPGKTIQEKVLKGGPACNRCTRIAKLGRVKKEAGDRLVLTGSNQSDTWGKMGIKICGGFYTPLMEMSKKEILEIADYLGIKVLKIGENEFREGCKMKHLLKPLAVPSYHGQAAAEANECLLKIIGKENYHSTLANAKIIGPLNKNIALVNLFPIPEERLKIQVMESLKKINTLEMVEILEKPIKLIVKANKGQFDNQHSRFWLEKGRLQPDFAVPITVEWRLTTNKNLKTFQVVDYQISE